MLSRDEIKNIIANYTDMEPDEIMDENELTMDLGLTSFDLISLISEFEIILGKSIDNSVLKHIQTVGDVYTYIEENTKESKREKE